MSDLCLEPGISLAALGDLESQNFRMVWVGQSLNLILFQPLP